MKNSKNKLKMSYVFLTVIAIVCVFIYFADKVDFQLSKINSTIFDDFIQTYTISLSASIITVILTVVLIDRVISNRQKKEVENRERIALIRLKISMEYHYQLLFNMLRASVETAPNNLFNSPGDLFDDFYFNEIKHFNFIGKAPVDPYKHWFVYLQEQFENFNLTLERTIELYGIYMGLDFIDKCEQLINSRGFKDIAFFIPYRCKSPVTKNNFFKEDILLNRFREYCNLYVDILNYYNSKVGDEHKVPYEKHMLTWLDSHEPYIGSSRVM